MSCLNDFFGELLDNKHILVSSGEGDRGGGVQKVSLEPVDKAVDSWTINDLATFLFNLHLF